MRRRFAVLGMAGVVTAALVAFAPAAAAAAPAPTTGTVSSGRTKLTVRSGPTAASAAVGALRNGAKVALVCSVKGPKAKGRVRTTDRWDRLTGGAYVSDAYVRRRAAPPACPPPPPPAPAPKPAPVIVPPSGAVPVGTWVAPLTGRGTSGFRTISRPDHDGVDLAAPRDTPIRAAADGTVVTVVCNTSGPSCDVDGSSDTRGCGWYVEIRHAGSLTTRYCHLIRRPEVVVGQQVTAGRTIGFVGTSGHSTGPHLHFEVHYGPLPATRLNAIDPAEFMSRAGAPVV
ncbi:peptidoglycan DD-metalloendopeptidase family protein [Dactylosporangium roseum]|uniref:Peptidoglycan DD-metalloendopeptidase family protein n=1 Tax=Dactylosporangium roseum TaxID=47989 RepID=A0ABY5ZGH7_9ACTN|nr:peptidoglycan DD-metalloendopeptidase family protein [Dactylosporangium roseum]UWZ40065.1 peptidoglycan DD-metalloendopeptidase family protein [Dactylosporangium roseum]